LKKSAQLAQLLGSSQRPWMKTTGVVPEAFAVSISLLSRSEMDATPNSLGRSGRSSDPSEPTTSSSKEAPAIDGREPPLALAHAADVDPTKARVMDAVQQPLHASAWDVMGPPAWKSLPSWFLLAEGGQMSSATEECAGLRSRKVRQWRP